MSSLNSQWADYNNLHTLFVKETGSCCNVLMNSMEAIYTVANTWVKYVNAGDLPLPTHEIVAAVINGGDVTQNMLVKVTTSGELYLIALTTGTKYIVGSFSYPTN